MKMSWKDWRAGMIVAVLSGAFTGVIGLGMGLTARETIILIVKDIAKDGLLYIRSNPVPPTEIPNEKPIV